MFGHVSQMCNNGSRHIVQITGNWASQKAMLSNMANKIKTCSKNQFPNRSKQMMLFLGWRPVGHPWWSNRFWALKMGPLQSQSAFNNRKLNQKENRRPPRIQKITPKSGHVTWPSGPREALTITLVQGSSFDLSTCQGQQL